MGEGHEVEARAEDARAGDARAVEVRKGKGRGWKMAADCVAGVWFTEGKVRVREGREVEARAVEVGKAKGWDCEAVTDRVAGLCFTEGKVRVGEGREVEARVVGRLVDIWILESLPLAGSVMGVWPDDVDGPSREEAMGSIKTGTDTLCVAKSHSSICKQHNSKFFILNFKGWHDFFRTSEGAPVSYF